MTRGLRHQLRCAACDTLFLACRSDTLYCGAACSQRAARQRQATRALAPATNGIDVRQWNGTPISRRADGYVNATAMCQAGGKRWNHYVTNDRTGEYLQALSGSAGIPADRLVVSVVTGPNHLRGTWIHPRLAVDLARWISPAFAVWMDGWFLEAVATPHKPAALPSRKAIQVRGSSVAEATHTWFETVELIIRHYTDDDGFQWGKFWANKLKQQQLVERLGYCILWEYAEG